MASRQQPHRKPLAGTPTAAAVDVMIDKKAYYLDASEPTLGFNKLSDECYNGHARIVSKNPLPVYFDADSLKERKRTTVIINNNDNGESEGGFSSNLGYYESLNLRNTIKEKGQEDFFKKVKSSYLMDVDIINPGIDSLKLLEHPVKVYYDFKINSSGEEFIYLNPMLTEAYKENPFKSLDRKYPVEMPYAFDETFTLLMYIPNGYVVDELPKSAKVSFNEGDGYFEYLIQKQDDRVELRSRIYFTKAYFLPDEYEDLRAFFGHVVKKQNEQIVFKKK